MTLTYMIHTSISHTLKRLLKIILPLWLQVTIRKKLWSKIYNEGRDGERESKRILKYLRKGNVKKVVIVYDNFSSPPTFGDYFLLVMFARYFIARGVAVSFLIVDGEYRLDWSALNEDETKNLVARYVQTANLLLDPSLATVEVITSLKLQARIRGHIDQGVDVPFREEVINRTQIYRHMFNTLSPLCFESSQRCVDRFLLSFDELERKVVFKKPEQPYITWHVRHSEKWGLERNNSNEEFLQIYDRLKALYPHHAIVIVSDEVGCFRFKELASQYDLNLLFSKDYSNSLLGDGGLILGSDYLFVLRSGGMGVFALFSRLPSELIIEPGAVVPWRHERLTSWATDNQIFRYSNRKKEIWPTLGVMDKSNSAPRKP